MMRWAWTKAVAAGLACAGFAAGQAPPARVSVAPPAPSSPPEATDGPRTGDVIALRSVGQPERKVTVLRVTRPDGGEALADLQDLATGARYTVPARMLSAKPKAVAPPARPPLVHNPTRWNRSAAAAPAATPTYTAPATPPKPPAVASKPVERPPDSPPPAAKREDPGRGTLTARAAPATVIPPVAALKALERNSRVKAAETQPAVRTTPVVRTPHRESPPPAVTSLGPPAPPPAPEVRPAALLDLLPAKPVPAADPTADETGPYLRDLFGALRPSVRERAATALAECRYGSRPEVKAQLAKAATSDPSPNVRAHCVKLLSKLGYHESRYLDELAGWVESGPPPLQQAARDALARLAAKN